MVFVSSSPSHFPRRTAWGAARWCWRPGRRWPTRTNRTRPWRTAWPSRSTRPTPSTRGAWGLFSWGWFVTDRWGRLGVPGLACFIEGDRAGDGEKSKPPPPPLDSPYHHHHYDDRPQLPAHLHLRHGGAGPQDGALLLRAPARGGKYKISSQHKTRHDDDDRHPLLLTNSLHHSPPRFLVILITQQAHPKSAVSWFAVGCYYAAVRKNEAAQRCIAFCDLSVAWLIDPGRSTHTITQHTS